MISAIKITGVAAIAALGSFAVSAASGTDIKFGQLSIEHGLSHNCVQAVFHDSRGYLWFGTENGLDQYDGYRIKVYFSEPGDSASLSHSFIRTICEDSSGALWVGTERGLNRYSRKDGTFTRFLASPDDPHGLSDDKIVAMLVDDNGDLWIGTDMGGLYKLVLNTDASSASVKPQIIPVSYTHLTLPTN